MQTVQQQVALANMQELLVKVRLLNFKKSKKKVGASSQGQTTQKSQTDRDMP